ncbi:MAG: hypothetical protein K2X60_08725, partial [Xanthobacteraceae bacterium]|nr:hypothetical protein [Xanthobacteraceae bacterium]
MPVQNSIHLYLNWAKERIDEMDATLTSLASKVSDVEADLRAKADKALADLEKRRDDFRDTVKKQAEAGEAAWVKTKALLESDWNAFEAEVKKYVESFGKQIEQQQATFALQSAAQLKAWHETADKFTGAAVDFAADRRDEIDAIVKRMKGDAEAAEQKFQKLSQAGNQS